MHRFGLAIAALAALTTASAACAAPVLMISIDGLRPADVLGAKARGVEVPTLTAKILGVALPSAQAAPLF